MLSMRGVRVLLWSLCKREKKAERSQLSCVPGPAPYSHVQIMMRTVSPGVLEVGGGLGGGSAPPSGGGFFFFSFFKRCKNAAGGGGVFGSLAER